MSRVDDTTAAPVSAIATASESDGMMGNLSARLRILMVVAMPLFLMATLIVCFVSAGHAPAPYKMAIVVAGSEQVTTPLIDQLAEQVHPDAFTITTTTSETDAKRAVVERDAVGAIAISDSGVTTYYATGGGTLQATTVKTVGAKIASALGSPSVATDLAPTPKDDPAGTSLFFFMVVCTLGSYLSLVALTMTTPKASLRTQLAAVVGSSVLGPLIGFTVIGSFVGLFNLPFNTIAAVVGVGALYALIVGLITTALARVAGLGGILIGMIVLITVNFPASGGTVAAATLPPFWQLIHDTWVGAGMLELTRGILYFDGGGAGRWSTQLLLWGAGAVISLAIVVAVKRYWPTRTTLAVQDQGE